MLQSIRERAQGWIAWTIVSILVLAFAMWGVESYFTGGGGAKNVVAKVGSHEITQGELNLAYDRMRRHQQMQQGDEFSLTPQAEADLKQKAMDQLIRNEVLSKANNSSGFRIANTQVDAVLATI